MNTLKKSRSPWPYVLIGYFIVFITFIVSFIVWACNQRMDLVADNYYDNEVRYQEQLDRLNHSKSLETANVVTYDTAQRSIVIALPPAQSQGATGQVHLYRPSDSQLDLNLPLAVDAGGVQRLNARELRAGLWKVRVLWSTGGAEYFLDQSVIIPDRHS